MPHPIISIDRIQREAKAAAVTYSDINDACPYPFGSDAAHAFSSAFKDARDAILSNPTPTHQ